MFTKAGAWRLAALSCVAVVAVLIAANGWPLLLAVAWAGLAGGWVMTSDRWKAGISRDLEASRR